MHVTRYARVSAALAVFLAWGAAPQAMAAIAIGTEQTLSAPGKYVLTDDISGTGVQLGALVIDASSGPIDVDLAGHTVTAAFSFYSVMVVGSGTVTLRNGVLSSSSLTALWANGTGKVRMAGVDLTGDWTLVVGGSTSLQLSNCSVTGNVYGLFFESGGSLLVRGSDLQSANYPCHIALAGELRFDASSCGSGYGTGMNVGLVSGRASVTGTMISGGDAGVHLTGDGIRFRGNTVQSSYNDGVTVYGSNCIVRNNTIAANDRDGVLLIGTGNDVSGNTIQDNLGCGIHFQNAGPNTVAGNVFSGNLGGDTCGPP